MRLAEIFRQGKETLSVVGLGYVGMPIAVAFAKEDALRMGRGKCVYTRMVYTFPMMRGVGGTGHLLIG